MLAWHVVWMAEHARDLTARLRQIGQAVALGCNRSPRLASAWARRHARGQRGRAVPHRLFMQSDDGALSLPIGIRRRPRPGRGRVGCRLLGTCRIPLGRLFSVTGMLVTLLAAGLAAQASHQLSNAGVLNVFDGPLWDTSWLLSEESWPGRVLHVLDRLHGPPDRNAGHCLRRDGRNHVRPLRLKAAAPARSRVNNSPSAMRGFTPSYPRRQLSSPELRPNYSGSQLNTSCERSSG